MSRVQLAINVTDLDKAITFYSRLFDTETWLVDPDGARWEWYVKSGDAGQLHKTAAGSQSSCATDDTTSATCCT